MFCNKCGAQNVENGGFCASCGNPLVQNETQQYVEYQYEEEEIVTPEIVKRNLIAMCMAIAKWPLLILFALISAATDTSALGVIAAIIFLVVPFVVFKLVGSKAVSKILAVGKKIAFWGWLILPFPVDIFTGMFSFAIVVGYGFVTLMFLDIVFALGAFIKSKKALNAQG